MLTSLASSTKLDVHKRTPEQLAADQWFLSQWRDVGRGGPPPLDPARFLFAKKGHFVEIVRKNATGEPTVTKINLKPRCYDKGDVSRILTKLAQEGASNEAIEEALADSAIKEFVVSADENSTGNKTTFGVAPMPEGTVQTTVPNLQPINGTVLKLVGDAFEMFPLTRAAYEEYLSMLRALPKHVNGFTLDFPCKEVAHLADKTSEMLAMLREQVSRLPGVEVYTAQPRWLRYYSDGDMRSQRSSGEQGIRSAPYPHAGGGEHMRPLLYDGPAWVVGLKLGDKLLPGRCYVNGEGHFICSDWCQREVDKGGGIDLYTGQNVKHTLMTWVAGPALSRFGGPKIQEANKLRPMRSIKTPTQPIGNPHVQAIVKAALRHKKAEAGKEIGAAQTPPANKTGILTVRYFEKGSKMGMLARVAGDNEMHPRIVIVNIPTHNGVPNIRLVSTEFLPSSFTPSQFARNIRRVPAALAKEVYPHFLAYYKQLLQVPMPPPQQESSDDNDEPLWDAAPEESDDADEGSDL